MTDMFNSELVNTLKENPIFGFAPKLMRNPVGFLESLTQERGPDCRFKVFGKEMRVLASRTHFQETMVVKAKIYGFPDMYKSMAAVIGEGITATPDGPYWKKKRLMLQPKFGPRTIQSFLVHFASSARQTVAKIADHGELFSLPVHQYSMDLALKNLFGCLFSQIFERPEVFEDFREISSIVGKRFWLPSVILLSKLTPSGRRLTKHIRMLDSLVYGVMEDRRRVLIAERPADFLTFLLGAKDPENDENLTDEQIRDELLNFVFAGYETTACLLSWSLILLAKNQKQLELARSEALSIGELCSADDYDRCTVIKSILNESLRLYPPVWMMIRQANQTDVLCGEAVSKNAIVLLSPYLLHRNPAEWSDPEQFRPERFLNAGDLQKLAFLPFGHGPRHCIGNHFAMCEAIAYLFYFVRDLDLEPIATLPKPEALITLQPPMDFRLQVTPLLK